MGAHLDGAAAGLGNCGPLRRSDSPGPHLDLSAVYNNNGLAEYVTEGGLRELPGGGWVADPVASDANLMTYRVGISSRRSSPPAQSTHNERNIFLTSLNRLRHPCLLLLMTALAGTAGRADAQSDPSPWRFGVTLGGGASVGVVAEYWSDDFGVEARLGTLAFQDVSVRLAPKLRIGTWDGGEAVWRIGAEWWLAGPALEGDPVVFAALHGVELARVTDGGHVIGLGYNLPLFGGAWGWREAFDDLREAPEDPDDTPDEDTEDPGLPSSWAVGAAVSVVVNFFLGELHYRYQPGGYP